ncbi:MAG: tyrosine-type recombinase/integrase [Coriobacteriia bacterium]|nr:tyrosine-type recombinase/integrase [Coriobacteriia bacterium]
MPLVFDAYAGISNIVERHWQNVVAKHPEIAAHDKVKPHLIRHSKATHLVEENVNLFHVRDFLGHSSITTTQVYLKSNPESMRRAIEAASSEVVAPCSEYYDTGKRAELMDFLNKLL